MLNKTASAKPPYLATLLREFEFRVTRNRAYSLRAFARDLGLSVSSLSLVLSGKQGLSATRAIAIARRLGLSKSEKNRFCDQVSAVHARSERARNEARGRLETPPKEDAKYLSLDYFATISDWYPFAILELTEIEDFKSDPRWIAKRIGLSLPAVEEALARLQRLGLLEMREGRYVQDKDFLATPSGVPSSAIRKFHDQMISKAQSALAEQSLEERDFSAVTLAMDRKDLEWVRGELKRFRRGLVKRLGNSKRKNSVYHLNLQLFRLDHQENTHETT